MRLALPFVVVTALAACGEVKPSIPDGALPVDAGLDATGEPDASGLVTLTIARTGAGVVTSVPSGLACGSTCSGQFAPGTLVTLTAVADAGSDFGQWGGGCGGALTTCTLTLTADVTVDATFAAASFNVTTTLVGNGTGTVTATPASLGLACPGACNASAAYGTSVTLTATPSGASLFVGWSGGTCTGTGPCTFDVTDDVAINAAFALNYSLIVTRTGTGTGAVSSTPAGIDCGADCAETFTANQLVTLVATPAPSSTFTGWTGAGCTGSGPCVVTMDAAKAVAASFALRQYLLTTTIGGTGLGTITSTPAGINCGADCSEAFDHGTLVMLTPTAGTNSAFVGWTGACSGLGTCAVTMDQARTVGATFALDSLSLSIAKAGNGAGTVVSTPAGINCGATCSAPFPAGTMVSLAATPAAGSIFAGWTGGGCSGTGPCTLTLAASATVTATFTLERFTLSVSRIGTGAANGQVTSAPAGISCGSDCSQAYDFGTTVVLTASGGPGATFEGWGTGSGCTGTRPCSLTITAATAITAQFAITSYTITTIIGPGGGLGTITSAPVGISCPGTCARPFAYGTVVTLRPTAARGHDFAGWSGACTGTGTCTITVTANATATATFAPPPNVGFVTSTVHTGNLGGLAGADAICQARAQGAGLAGTYRAWLSTSTVNASDRFGSATGWVRTDGKPFVRTIRELTERKIFYPLILNERGASEGSDPAWTGTDDDGDAQANTCSDWTSTATSGTVGYPEYGNGAFTQNGGGACTTSAHLYCLGIDYTATVAPVPQTAVRRAFVSAVGWAPGAGLAGADALCTSQASAAGLPGTYRALLAGVSTSAASRFSTNGLPWARVDDVLLSTTAAGFLAPTGTHWLASLDVTATGAHVYNAQTWAGATTLAGVGTLATTGVTTSCAGWTTASPTTYGAVGGAGSSRVAFAFANYGGQTSTTSCASTNNRLMCLQQ